MKVAEYREVLNEIRKYIDAGMPIAASHVFERHRTRFTHKQYYFLSDVIHKAFKERYDWI